MDWPTPQRIKLALFAISAMMMLLAAHFSSPAVLSNNASAQANISRRNSATNPNLILLKRGAIDTAARRDLDTAAADLNLSNELTAASNQAQKRTRVIQFAGPIKRSWIEQLRAIGAEIIAYVPNNAYIIRGSSHALARVAAMDAGIQATDARPVRWIGRLEPIQKLDTAFTDEMLAASDATLDVEIELIDSPEAETAIEQINALAVRVNHEPRRFLNYAVVSVALPVKELLAVAALDEVLFINPGLPFNLHDERSAQIVAGNLTADLAQPAAPGYLNWLASKGLSVQPDFVIDFADTGLDRGSTAAILIHPDFRDGAGNSRVAYNINYTQDNTGEDRSGHGTLVASVACGLGSTDREDAAGYMYGLGVDPTARLGASRIFDYRGKLPFQFNFADAVSAAYQAGARISNNSWGNGSNSYDIAAQQYDAFVRDAQPAVPGNQEMTFIFSAGNNGAGGHVSSPGLAKNVISVAASESYRPEGTDSCNLDGEGSIGPDGANNAQDILRYSSGGPTLDARAKPDIAAPGTHIFGAASQSPQFFAEGLCPGVGVYQPPGQQLYTWSSGTSLAAPHVTGAAALTRKFFIARNLLGDARAPSPAMTKAFLLNAASYMTGQNAAGDLPAERQGWGLVNLARAFDDTKRLLVDQTRLFTESGQTFEIEGSLADRARGLRVTLAWTDAPGALVGAAIVNDLDLEILIGGVTVYRGNNFAGATSIEGGEADRLNNVEAIYLPPDLIPQGSTGNFRIVVRAANIAGDGVPGNGNDLDQDFALVVYNITDPVIDPPPPPPRKVPVITTATYIKKRLTITGRDFTSAARVEINGEVVNREFEFDAATNSLSIKLKYRKLNLQRESDNRIVLIEDGERSEAFVLRL